MQNDDQYSPEETVRRRDAVVKAMLNTPPTQPSLPNDPFSIQVIFVGPNGEKTEGPLITPSHEPPRQFDEEAWDKDRSIREFCIFLQSRDGDGLVAAMRALDRLGCWREALGQFMSWPSPNESLGAALVSFWVTYGFHIASSLKGDLILCDVFKRVLPPYMGRGLTLYRGELNSRHMARVYGHSWTPKRDIAEMFANRRYPGEGQGVVLEIEATPEMIIATPSAHSSRLGEQEYLIDPRLIQVVRVLS